MAGKKEAKKSKAKQPDPPAPAPTRSTRPTLSRASSDGPDPALKAAKASDGGKKGSKKPKMDVGPGEKVVRVVDQSEEKALGMGADAAAVEELGGRKSRKAKVAAGGVGIVDGLIETPGTKGNQREEVLNELDGDDQPVKSALKQPSAKAGKKQAKEKSSISTGATAKSKGKSAPVVAPKSATRKASQADEDAFLDGFDSDGFSDDDSSDDEDAGEPAPVDLKDLPKVKDGKKGKELEKAKKKNEKPVRGVVYLGHLPHGFYEAQLSSYLSQFGTVKRLRLSRSKRTGRSKGYAFVEFEHLEVAQIVVETMNDYLLSGRLIKAEVVEQGKVHRRMWEGSGKKFRPDQSKRIAREKHNADKAPAQQSAIAARLVRRESAKRKRLEELGIDYDFPGYAGSADASKTNSGAKKDEAAPKAKKSKMDEPTARKGVSSAKGDGTKPRKPRASTGGDLGTMKLRDGKKKAARKSV